MDEEEKHTLEMGEVVAEKKKGGLLERLYDRLYDSAVTSIPIDRLRATSDRKLVVSFGIVMKLVSLFVFAFFLAQTFMSAQNAPYLALDRNGGNCNYVPKTISGTWTHSYNGLWSNQFGYNPTFGYISFSLSSLAVDVSGFTDLITRFKVKYLDPLGLDAKTSPPQYNLLNWLHFSGTIETEGGFVQSMSFTGEARAFFGGGSYAFSLANSDFVSTITPSQTKYDLNTGQVKMSFSLSSWNADTVAGGAATCLVNKNLKVGSKKRIEGWSIDKNILDKARLGFVSKYASGLVDINFDFVSLTVAAAFNLGIPNNNLVFIDMKDSWSFVHNGVTYKADLYSDVKNPGMTPIICMQKIGGTEKVATVHPIKDVCFYYVGFYSSGIPMLGVPILSHTGSLDLTNMAKPATPCTCPLPVNYNTYVSGVIKTSTVSRSTCQDPIYVSGVFFYPQLEHFTGSNSVEITVQSPQMDQSSSPTNLWVFPEDPSQLPVLNDWCTAYFAAAGFASKINCLAAFVQAHADHPWLPAHGSLLETVGIWPNFPNAPDLAHPMTTEVNDKFAAAIQEQIALWEAWAMNYQFGKALDLVAKYSPRDLVEQSYGTGFYSFAPSIAELAQQPCVDGDSAFANPIYDGFKTTYEAFKFCDYECTSLSVMSGSGYLGTNAVNSAMLQLPWLACNDTFNLNSTSFNHLLTTPPTALVEQYFKCTPFIKDTLTNAIGIAAGMVGTAAPIAALLLSTALFLWLYTKGAVPEVGLEEIKAREFASKMKSEVSSEVTSKVEGKTVSLVQSLAASARAKEEEEEEAEADRRNWHREQRDDQQLTSNAISLAGAPLSTLATLGDTTLSLVSLGMYTSSPSPLSPPYHAKGGRNRGRGGVNTPL